MHRFLQRLWRLIVDEATGETLVPPRDEPPLAPHGAEELWQRLGHRRRADLISLALQAGLV